MVSFSYKDVSPLGHFYINKKEHKRAKRDLDIFNCRQLENMVEDSHVVYARNPTDKSYQIFILSKLATTLRTIF